MQNNFENILFPLYIAAGPLVWGLVSLGLYLGQVRMARLRRPPMPMPQPAPSVSVLVPAKDEGLRVQSCLRSILQQDYPFLNVIAIDDRSTDQTAALMDSMAAADDRLRVLRISALPDGWLGKCHALHRGAAEASGQWLLFVDSDVILATDALRSALSLCVARNYDTLSLLTRLQCQGWWEGLILPLAAGAWSIMYAVSLTNSDRRKHIALANGQFLLCRAEVYRSVGGHESVKNQITEDVELMRRIKARDYKTRFFMGRDFASTRMHTELVAMFNGWARIFSGTSGRRPWRILGAVAFIILAGLSAYVAMALGIYRSYSMSAADHTVGWLIAGGAHWSIMTAALAVIYRWSGNTWRWALAFPASAAMLLVVFCYALVKCATGTTHWRGTVYQHQEPAGGVNSEWVAGKT